MERVISGCGLFVMLFLAWLLSNNKKKLDWRLIGSGVALQFVLAVIVLKTAPGQMVFNAAKQGVDAIIALSDEGAKFVFGADFSEHFFAFKVLPTIIFVSSLSYLLFHWGIIQKVVEVMALIMKKIMNCSGAESLCAAANVFMGQTEAPILIRPYLDTMTKSEIMAMMTGGMATVAGGVLAAYVGFGISAGHLLAASIMSAPAALVIAKIMYPETEVSPTKGEVKISVVSEEANFLAAACKGAADGLQLAINVGAMLIAFISLVALINLMLSTLGSYAGFDLTFEMIIGWLFQPLAFVMGVPWEDCDKIGQLLGERIVINEFLAYIHLAEFAKEGLISQRSYDIAIYALCGFANFSSIAIQIGGIGTLAPKRRDDFAKSGFKAMIGGALASFMTACIAGMLI